MSAHTITIEREVEFTFAYEPAQRETRTDPGFPEEWEISATLDGHDIELTDEETDRAIEIIREGAQEAKNDAAEARYEARRNDERNHPHEL